MALPQCEPILVRDPLQPVKRKLAVARRRKRPAAGGGGTAMGLVWPPAGVLVVGAEKAAGAKAAAR
eukprot:scaffold25071_cov73-Isochrysis_galbana.AAC.2